MAGRTKFNKDTVVKNMTLEEKATLVNGATFFGMAAIPRLGIPRLQCLDGGTGMNFEQLFGDFYSHMEAQGISTNGMMGSTVLTHVIDYYYEPEKLTEEELEVYKAIKEMLEEKAGSNYAPGCFPPGILLGATFNKDVVKAVGQALGAEAQLFDVQVLLGSPNVNIHRDPLNGRLFEGYSEDPCLVSTLAPELVKGVQEYNVVANVKHFAANNQETNRVGINETISRRALEEIYYPGFKACVKEGQVKSVMSAYNRINGVPCTENKDLLQTSLREEWGFEGMVLSDWGAVYHPVEAIQGGNDLAMPGPISGEPLVQAVKDGRLKEEELDASVEKILWVIDSILDDSLEGKQEVEIGTETVSLIPKTQDEIDNAMKTTDACFSTVRFGEEQLLQATTKTAYDAACEGIVLLKNNNMFPLKQENSNVLLLGSGAKKLLECGTGSAGITTNRTSSLEKCLQGHIGYNNVTLVDENVDIEDVLLCGDSTISQKSIQQVIYIATISGMEGNDRTSLQLSKDDEECLMELKKYKDKQAFQLCLVLNSCGPIDTRMYEDFVDAIFVCFLPGMEGGHALADLMTGIKTPSGKLPITFPKRYEDTPTYLNFPGDGYEVNYGEGIYVGYRYYDKKKVEPAYAFGYGLSYTTFEISDICISETKRYLIGNEMREGLEKEEEMNAVPVFTEELACSVTIKNTGKYDGAEVLQVYIADPYTTLPKPVKELKVFEKVYLEVGEEKEINFTISKEQFASYDMDYSKWIAEEGYYDVIVATSSRQEDEKGRIRVYLDGDSPYSYGLNSTVKVIYEQEQLKKALVSFWRRHEWDWQIVESNYQYTPNRKIKEILPEAIDMECESVQEFVVEVSKVLKK